MEKQPLSILIIDDDEDDIFILESLLKKVVDANVSIKNAMDFDEGWELLKQKNFDVCFTDYRMGAMSGIDLVMRAKEFGAMTQFVVLTGKGDQVIAVEAMKAGASDYLEKGKINAEILERTLRYLLDKAENLQLAMQSQEIYQTIFRRSGDAIFLLNSEFDILETNPEFLIYFPGLAGKKINFRELLPDSKSGRKIWNSLSNPEIPLPENLKVNFGDTQKSNSIFLLSIHLLDVKVEVDYKYLGILKNITSFMKAQKQMRIAEKLSLTGRMSRVIGHEVRNPLTNIKLATDQLSKTIDSGSSKVFLDILSRNALRIENLINELLQSARPASNERSPASLNNILRKIIEENRDRIQLNNIDLHVSLQDDIPEILASELTLSLALSNLIVNAIEAMTEEGENRLLIQTVTLPGVLQLSIRDNGVGMDSETMDQIFDPYFTKKQNGTGLGLTATLNIIEAHHGELTVHSWEGKGTEFTIRFPIE